MPKIQGLKERLEEIIDLKFGGNGRSLARKAKISWGTFERYITEKGIPRGDLLIRISEAADISIDWLLMDKKIKPEHWHLISLWEKSDDRGKSAAIRDLEDGIKEESAKPGGG